jgi:hypothetical protein
MTRMAIVAIIVLALGAGAAAQTPPRDVRVSAPPAPTGTGSVSGVVVTAESGTRPIRLANVVIIGATTGTLRVTSTDGSGRFAFAGLAADRYVIGASKEPYLGTMAGARRPARSGTPIALGDGQKIADITIRMPLGAAITGSISDERGQPGANVTLVLQQWRMQNGERTLVSVPRGNGYTDERGRYRIYGLPPGEYIISAARDPGVIGATPIRALTDAAVNEAIRTGRSTAAPPVANARYAPVFYPGTVRAGDATPIILGVGEERQGVDMRLELVRTARVEGIVESSDRQPLSNTLVQLAVASSDNRPQLRMGVAAGPDGRFMFPGVTPGSYTLIARGSGAQAGRFASAQVEVTGADQAGIQLTMRPPLTLSARLAFEGTTTAPALAGRRVPLRTLTPATPDQTTLVVGPTNATGVFSVTNVVPGRYVLGGPLYFGATPDSVAWSLQSVIVDGRDLTDLPLDITADTAPKEIVVTYVDRWQELSGRLTRGSGEVATDYTVVVFPSDKAYWIPGSRRIVTSRPGTDGRFVLSGPGLNTLPPGDYLVAAVTDIDRDEQFDPAFLASIVPAAIPVQLGPGEKKTQNLVMR